MREVLF
ncbi:hypothetical protein D030_4806A, partial [Vibrio parahaemolyticus AQ3810]